MNHRRVRPPKLAKEISEHLVDNGPFESKQKLLMFAAAVGVQLGRRTSFSSSDVAIRWDIFERNNDEAFIYSLAIAETGGLDILSDDHEDSEDFLVYFEEYAHTGLQYLEENVVNSPGDPLDELIGLFMSMEDSEEETPEELEGLTQKDLDVLGL
ncbi:DNA phosphorothioation-associated protein 4 [Salinibacter sp.]|uniref:DNA phosphorothioation-associated protein 4 n=1 Tax=Salinibacter sp. TaxID=2065818 RepID=UPI0021E7757D|nr:DNA phosphorothioation-associated protein 4 [Salinibacter sp.]